MVTTWHHGTDADAVERTEGRREPIANSWSQCRLPTAWRHPPPRGHCSLRQGLGATIPLKKRSLRDKMSPPTRYASPRRSDDLRRKDAVRRPQAGDIIPARTCVPRGGAGVVVERAQPVSSRPTSFSPSLRPSACQPLMRRPHGRVDSMDVFPILPHSQALPRRHHGDGLGR